MKMWVEILSRVTASGHENMVFECYILYNQEAADFFGPCFNFDSN